MASPGGQAQCGAPWSWDHVDTVRQRLPLLVESPPGRNSLPPTVCTAALLTVAKVSGLITCGRLVAGQEMPAKREAGKKVEATYGAQCWWEMGGGAGTKELPPSVSADTRTPEQGVEDGQAGHCLGGLWGPVSTDSGHFLKARKLEPWPSAPALVGWGCFGALTLWRSQQSGGRQSDGRSQEAP